MDATILNVAIYLTATFAAALVTGVAGFAFGLIAAAIWLHILTPMQTATLIIAFGLVVQGISVWKLRHALRWSRLWPFLLGAAFGVPLGVAILGWTRPDYVRVTVGVVLALYSAYSLARGRAARDLPADRGRDIRHERAVAGDQRRDIDRHRLVLWHRPSGIAGRDVAGTKALRTSR